MKSNQHSLLLINFSFLLCGLLFLLLLGGCDSNDNTAGEVSDKRAANIFGQDADEKAVSKKDYELNIDAELEKLRLEVNSVQEMLSEMGTKVDQETEQSVIVFNREMEEYAQNFQAFQQAPNDNWEDVRKKVDAGMTELRDVLFVMRTQVEAAYEKFDPETPSADKSTAVR